MASNKYGKHNPTNLYNYVDCGVQIKNLADLPKGAKVSGEAEAFKMNSKAGKHLGSTLYTKK